MRTKELMPDEKTKELAGILRSGGVVVFLTDTIYGISSLALDEKAVERIYEIKKREKEKPFIILISDISQLELFGVEVSGKTEKFLEKVWPGKVSVILPISKSKQFELKFLHRGVGALGFRMPDLDWLQKLIQETGPLVSTSANVGGYPPAKNIQEAKKYFGQEIDSYLDGGISTSAPSSLVKIENGRLEILRKGEFDFEKKFTVV
jgi:L-threonylcarbamoyladenylate synthase